MKFTFTLTQEQVGLIGASLAELPYKVSSGLIDELNRQVAPQLPKAESPKSDEPKKIELDAAE